MYQYSSVQVLTMFILDVRAHLQQRITSTVHATTTASACMNTGARF